MLTQIHEDILLKTDMGVHAQSHRPLGRLGEEEEYMFKASLRYTAREGRRKGEKGSEKELFGHGISFYS